MVNDHRSSIGQGRAERGQGGVVDVAKRRTARLRSVAQTQVDRFLRDGRCRFVVHCSDEWCER